MKKNLNVIRKNKIKTAKGADMAYKITVIFLSVLAFVIVLYPVYFIVIASISDSTLVNQGQVVFSPKGVNFYGYQQIFQNAKIWEGYRNTIIYSVIGTIFNLVLTIPAAYVLSRKNFRPRKLLMFIFVFTMYFNGGMIPTYMLVKSVHLLDTPWVLIIMGGVNVYNLIITRTFFENSIPDELYEAATLDGCSHFNYFMAIVLPLSKASVPSRRW